MPTACSAQLADTRLQQIADQELLQIGARQREALPAQQFGQPRGDEGLLAGMGERWLGQVAAQPGRKAHLVPMLGLIDQPQVALQIGQEARDDLAAVAIDIDLAAFGYLQAGTECGQVVGRWRGIVGREVPRIVQHLRVIEQLQAHPARASASCGTRKRSPSSAGVWKTRWPWCG